MSAPWRETSAARRAARHISPSFGEPEWVPSPSIKPTPSGRFRPPFHRRCERSASSPMPDRAPVEPASIGLPATVAATVVTVGTFDGVHRGHQQVLARLAKRAAETGWRSVLVTFEPHPLEIVNPAAARPLLSVGMEKFEVLAESGIDYCVVLPFTPTLARYAPADFVDHVLRARFRMREMISGYDNGFGRGRSGDVETIRALGAKRGFRVEIVPPTAMDD